MGALFRRHQSLFLGLVVVTSSQSAVFCVDGRTSICLVLFTSSLLLCVQGEGYQSFSKLICQAIKVFILVSVSYLSAYSSLPTKEKIQKLNHLAQINEQQNKRYFRRAAYRKFKIELSGEVSSEPERKRVGEISFGLKGDIETINSVSLLLRGADLPWSGLSTLERGDLISAELELSTLAKKDSSLPNPFSYQGYLLRRGFIATGKILSLRKAETTTNKNGWRKIFINNVISSYGENEALGIILAVSLGEKSLLGKPIYRVFRETGTAHLLVISGFHVGMVFSILYLLGRWLITRSEIFYLYIPVNVSASLSSFVGVTGYVMITGLALTTLRALLILGIFVLAEILGRRRFFTRNILLAFIAMNFVWPGAFFGLGAQLTFAALVGLGFAIPYCRSIDSLDKAPWLYRFLVKTLVLSFGAWLATAPIIILWFNHLVPSSALFNTIMIPLFTLSCLCIGNLAIFCLAVSIPGASYLLELALGSTSYLLDLIFEINSIAGAWGIGFVELGASEKQPILIFLILSLVMFSFGSIVLEKGLNEKLVRTVTC